MKARLAELIATYKDMLPTLRGKARYVLTNVIEDLEQLLETA